VLVDLGFADASERRLRVELAMRLNELIAARRLTQAGVAQLLGIPQPHVSEFKHYKLSRFPGQVGEGEMLPRKPEDGAHLGKLLGEAGEALGDRGASGNAGFRRGGA